MLTRDLVAIGKGKLSFDCTLIL